MGVTATGARAGVWTPDAGSAYQRLAFNFFRNDASFSAGRDRREGFKEFTNTNLTYYLEDGIRDRLAFFGQGTLPLRSQGPSPTRQPAGRLPPSARERPHPRRHAGRRPCGGDDLRACARSGGRTRPREERRDHPPLSDAGRGGEASGRRVQPYPTHADRAPPLRTVRTSSKRRRGGRHPTLVGRRIPWTSTPTSRRLCVVATAREPGPRNPRSAVRPRTIPPCSRRFLRRCSPATTAAVTRPGTCGRARPSSTLVPAAARRASSLPRWSAGRDA